MNFPLSPFLPPNCTGTGLAAPNKNSLLALIFVFLCKTANHNSFRFNYFCTLCTNQPRRKRRISPVFSLLRTLAKTMAGWGYDCCSLASLFCRRRQLIFLFLNRLRTLCKNTRVYPYRVLPGGVLPNE